MSNPDREPVGAIALAAVLALLIGGIVTFGFGSGPQMGMALLGLILIFGMASHHDRVHQRRSERPHAMLGWDDRNTPGSRRRRA